MSSPFSKWQASKHHIKLSYHFSLHFSKFNVLSSKNSSQDLLEAWQSYRMEMVETRICEHWWFCNDPREQSHGTEGPRKRGFCALTWCPCTWSVHKMPILPPWTLTIMLGAGTYFQLPPPALPCRPPWLPLPRINILLTVSISWNTWPAGMMTKGTRMCFWRLCRLCRATVMNYHKLSSLNNQKVLCPTRHICNPALFPLWPSCFILSGAISNYPLFFLSSILDTFQPGGLIFWCHIFLPFHTVHGVLVARILQWIAIPSSSGPRFVRTLHYDWSILGGPAQHGS